ncbi:retropepsin-like aspartic protease family protein [Thiohalophilus sp.]|uniref:retropepsin-like aspartic protease family protein n=1 Tax=Thiohalophilus sp. TaxID=3028392 RepID=UPI002ACD3095|nr:TIGR02281 family clan AA aspartic protease [Thiohalophilus sp.]MDZ7805050.1 TIGR02281 family clan AA aspartic protease [Thiohalophilus sp.]
MNSPEQQQRKIGKSMVFAMWLVLLALLTLFFDKYLGDQQNPNQQVVQRQAADGSREVVLKQNRYGHYVANGKINGQEVTFLLDTGATDIAIPENVANRLGLERGRQVTFQTANGLARGYATRLDSVSLGHIRLTDLPASINPNVSGDEILLGMSFLKQLELNQKDNILTLRQ